MTAKTTAAIVGTIIILATDVSATEKPGWLRRIFGRLSWEEIAAVCQTPKNISAAVRHRVVYKADPRGEWQTGKETWQKATGDCEDFAAAVIDLCKENGIKAQMIIFRARGSREAHAVAAGTYKGKLWVSSNGRYEEYQSIDDATRRLARDIPASWGQASNIKYSIL